MKLISWIALILLCACSRGQYGEELDTATGGSGNTAGSGSGAGTSSQPLPRDVEFELRPEFDGPCERATIVDVNLGNAPEAFVRAAHCQINGSEPDAALVDDLSNQLRTVKHLRRVDAVRTLCAAADRNCSLQYSDPWVAQVDLTKACQRKGTRDLGAVLMYWSECPGGVNCGMNWANTHAPGMSVPSQLFASGGADGYYTPKNTGFWRRELLDARWSGLQFLLLNTYGPDMVHLPRVVEALADIGGGIQVALFDDTWGWGRGGGAPFDQMPDFNNTEAAAQLIYQKWQQFYRAIPSAHWYRYQGRPLIAFYNAGTLKPENKSAATLARLRELFNAEFGEDPFLAIDRAFFQDPNQGQVADSEFRWNTFSNNSMSQSNMKGVTFAHFMSKWDAIGRENSSRLATANDLLVKGPELLEQYLLASQSSNLAMMATWNDLGEGTGITRNYDYYYQGQWLPPNAFMQRIRSSQCQ